MVLEVETKGRQSVGVKVGLDDAILHCGEKWVDALVVGDIVTLLNPVVRVIEDETHLYTTGEGSCIFIQHNPQRGKVQIAEVFAGIAGWSRACEVFGEEVNYFVEKDSMTAAMRAKQHKCEVVTPVEFIQRALNRQLMQKAVIIGDIEDPQVWVALVLYLPHRHVNHGPVGGGALV